MGSISFVCSKQRKPVAPFILDFLSSQKHRGYDFFEINAGNGIKFRADALNVLADKSQKEKPFFEAIAFSCFAHSFSDFHELIDSDDAIYIDGEIFNRESLELLRCINSENIHSNLKKFVSSARGDFACAFKLNNSFYFLRDFLGAKPLWFGFNSGFFAVASELRALRKIDIAFPQKLKAGHLLEFNGKEFIEKKLFDFSDLRGYSGKKASFDELVSSFEESVSLRTKGINKAGIYFSGGVDSALIAKAVSDKVKKTTLFSVGFPDAPDVDFAKKSAKEMNLELEIVELKKNEISEKLFSTLKALYLFDEMQIEIGLAEFVLAEYISQKKVRHVFSGQGSDELFCGYTEFRNALKKEGFDGAQEKIFWFLEAMDGRNFYREDMIASKFDLSLRAPLLDLEFVKKAISFPAREKILSENDELRKHPIRKMASHFGVPKISFTRKKKAMQYGSLSAKYRNYLK